MEKTVKGSMTEGAPLPLILRFAVPLLLGNLLQQLYNMIDAAIVGRILGADALAGVGASSSVQFLVLGFCIGICAGFSIPVAKYFGARQEQRLKVCIFNSYLLTGIIALVLTVSTSLLCRNILDMMSTPERIYKDAYAYLLIIFLGIPFILLYNLLAGIMRAVGDSKTPFIFLAVSTFLNIFLDFLLIAVIPLGCAGAALATVIAQAASGIACFIYIQKKYALLRLSRSDCSVNGYALRELFIMGIPMGLQYSITAIGCMVMQAANNGLGSVCISGFTAASKLKQLAMCPFDAVATGVSVFSSQNLGAGKTDRIRNGILDGVAIGSAYGAAIGAVLIFFGRTMSMMFVSASETAVLDASGEYLFYAGFFFWILGILNTTRMTIQGLGYSAAAVFSGVIEMIARIAVSRAFVPQYGFKAICFVDQCAWASAAIYCSILCVICVKLVTKKSRASIKLPCTE